ncbi:MAG: cysteine--tRNA ligase [Microgenomates group bacterium]
MKNILFRLYNTLTRQLEEFKPIHPPEVRMYTCGMTVYDHTTVGHMRTYVNTDFLRRTLEYLGYKVRMVENVTDVGHLVSDADVGEDKLQKKAEKERKSAWEIAREYEKEFYETLDKLNVLRPTVVTRATENIKEMIELVADLEKKGYTYVIPGDGVYFDTAKFPDYGKMAKINEVDLKAGARVEMVPGKRNLTDFALWKFSPPDKKRDMEWESPWSKRSFPGWHIECSVMAMKFLTPAFSKGKYQPERFETIDLHTGGEDHIMIHHPNEIAQTEASTGKKFANFWFHNRFLMVEGRKMSKSLGNFYTLKDIEEKGFSPLAVRYLFATAHYRQRLNFTWEALAAAQTAFNRLYENVAVLRDEKESVPVDAGGVKLSDLEGVNVRVERKETEWRDKFIKAISDDLNMPQAIAVVWEMLRSGLDSKSKYQLLLDWDRVLGLGLEEVGGEKWEVEKGIEEGDEIRKLVDERERLRKEKKWQEADEIRKEVEKRGFIIEDTARGYRLKRKLGKT